MILTTYCVIAFCFMLFFAGVFYQAPVLAKRAGCSVGYAQNVMRVMILASVVWPLIILLLIVSKCLANLSGDP